MESHALLEQLAGQVKHGDHLCAIFDDPRLRIEAAAQYLADGLRQNEFVMYAADAATTNSILERLQETGIDVSREMSRGALMLPSAYETYLRGGDFDPEAMYQTFERAISDALASGFSGCRFAGEPVWAIDRASLRPGLLQFERRLNELFASRNAAGLCVYDRGAWPASVVRDVLRTHPVAVVGDLVCRNNIYYELPARLDDDEVADKQVRSMLARLRELRTHEARLQIALEAGRLGSWELDLTTDTASRSLRHDQIFGYDRPPPMWGYDVFMQHVLPEDRERVDSAFRHAIEHKTTWQFECRIRRVSDGAIRWIEAHGRPDPDPASGSRVERLLGIVADITERKELEQALRDADRRKDEFLATLAHELRNPLAPISNAVELLRLKGPPDPQLERAQAVIDRQVRHLVRLVDDLLEVSRITTGRIHLQRERLELQAVLASAIETVQPMIEASQHAFAAQIPREPIHVEGDATRLTQVFLNLLNNAAKYTPRGGRIGLDAEQSGGEAIVRIRDTGVGIAQEIIPHLFEMFVQGEHSQGGLGIGLSLTNQLLELHGGSIEARSPGPGRGSEFIVRLPLCLPAEAPLATANSGDGAAPIESRRVLVVDDNVDAADSLAATLELFGHEVVTSYDGESALADASRFSPDAVILDIGLPDMSGYDVARALRRQMSSKPVLIALTGWGQDRDRESARQAGFDLHFTKPADATELLQAIAGEPVALPAGV